MAGLGDLAALPQYQSDSIVSKISMFLDASRRMSGCIYLLVSKQSSVFRGVELIRTPSRSIYNVV
jgi:hypothetical protein